MTTPFNTVGASPLGAFIQSALGARGLDTAEMPVLWVLGASVYALDPADLSILVGPYPAPSNRVDLAVDMDAMAMYVRTQSGSPSTLRRLDFQDTELWASSTYSGAGLAYTQGEIFTGRMGSVSAHIDVRQISDGAVIDSFEIETTARAGAPFGFDAIVLGLRADGDTLYALTQRAQDEQHSGSGQPFYSYRLHKASASARTVSASVTIATDIDLSFPQESGPGIAPRDLGFGAGHLFVSQWDYADEDPPDGHIIAHRAYDLDLSAVPALDFVLAAMRDHPLAAIAGPFIFLNSPGSSAISRREITGTITHSQSLVAARDLLIAPIGPLPPLIEEIADEPHTEVGDGYEYQAELIGGAPVAWTITDGPSGTDVGSAGLVTMPPQGDGAYGITVRATNALGFDEESWTVTVTDARVAPIIDAVANDDWDTTEYTKQLTLSQGSPPITWSVLQGPTGTSVDQAGLVTMPAQSDGVYTLEVKAENAQGSDAETWTVTVSEAVAPVIVPLADDSHASGVFYAVGISLSAGTGPLTWSFDSGNPSGMIIGGDEDGGSIFWLTPVPGVYTITYRATNSAGFDTDTFELTVT